jgi:hypothetical protein
MVRVYTSVRASLVALSMCALIGCAVPFTARAPQPLAPGDGSGLGGKTLAGPEIPDHPRRAILIATFANYRSIWSASRRAAGRAYLLVGAYSIANDSPQFRILAA